MKDKLESLYAKIVKDLAGNRCERCGNAGELHAHHAYKKDTIALKYYVPGMVCLCKWLCHPWAEDFPEEQEQWFIEERGQKAWDKLVELRRTTGMTLEEAERGLKEYDI